MRIVLVFLLVSVGLLAQDPCFNGQNPTGGSIFGPCATPAPSLPQISVADNPEAVFNAKLHRYVSKMNEWLRKYQGCTKNEPVNDTWCSMKLSQFDYKLWKELGKLSEDLYKSSMSKEEKK